MSGNNTDPQFAGIAALKARHKQQSEQFEAWARRGDWQAFHDEHYDWWTFPIDESSRGQGMAYTVYEGDIAELQKDAAFMRDLRRGAELVAASWGWNLHAADYLASPAPDQRWQDWPVRLYKAARCMKLFGCTREFDSLKKFALLLLQQGRPITYGGYDLSWLFTTGIDPRGVRHERRP